jgi:hypothetical protein
VNGNRLLTRTARLAVRIGWVALLALGAFILLTRAPVEWLSRALAWLLALLVLAWLLAHLRVRRHGARGPHRDLGHELGFDLATPAHAPRRASLRRTPWGFYRHRSHAGERPRFD